MTIYKVGTKKYKQANKTYGSKKKRSTKSKINTLNARLKNRRYTVPFRKYFSTEFSHYR